ncbi:MAG: two-component regulator propeller domain-containing protein [Bacteroidota bacterium]|nr:two-component regulator propeller domain-containing protein [Bacteroidota bacterium]
MNILLNFKSIQKLAIRFLLLSLLFYIFNFQTFAQPRYLNFDNFTIESGLSNNVIHYIFQDKKGWMWFGSSQGLNKFDGYKFTCFNQNPANPQSLDGKLVRSILEDTQGSLWVGTEKGGLNKFNREKETFTHFYEPFQNFTLKGKSVNIIRQDRKGMLWLGTNKGLVQFDPDGKIIAVFSHQDKNNNSLINNDVKVIQFDPFGNLWIGTKSGLDIFNPATRTFRHVIYSSTMPGDEIQTIFRNDDGQMWVGTFKQGIFIINPLTLKSKQFIIDPTSERGYTVRSIIKDKQGKYWIGTRGGLYIYSGETGKYSFFSHDDREAESLCHNSIMDIFQDAKGDIWIATRSGISYAVSEKQVFRKYKALPHDNRYLNNNELYAFWMDGQGKLYIGTEEGGINVLNCAAGTFSYIMHDKNNSGSLSKNCVKALLGDNAGNLWAGTYMGGINVINLKTGHITQYQNQPGNDKSLSHNMVWALYLDPQNNMWVGTEIGLDRFDTQTNSFVHYNNIVKGQQVIWIKSDSQNDLWVSTNDNLMIYNQTTHQTRRYNIRSRMMLEDKHGRFWLTTLDKGLAQFDKNKGIVKFYDQSKGIANNQSYGLIEDNAGYFWISTINGLSRFNPEKETFKNFDRQDGLQNNQFQYGACYKTPEGELIFGGITGFNIFNPAEIKDNGYEPPIVLTALRIFNKEITLGSQPGNVLQKSINESHEIELRYSQNVFTLEFVALNYANASKNKYQYRLKGFEKEWNAPTLQHSVTYTNLDPGEYVFMVRGANNDGVWNKKPLEVKIKILPPFWKTWWFKILLITFILFLIYYSFRFWENRRHLQYELVYERERAKKLHELDMMKVRFFTNVSHEIRTPLTLIASPLEKMLNSNMTIKEMKAYLVVMSRNTHQLLKLVNQLLDFRKIESGSMKLEPKQGDLVVFIRDIVKAFAQLATEKNIQLNFNSVENELFTFFDSDKLEKIVNNLLSNSLKFTPQDGAINVNLSLVMDDSDGQSNKPEKFVEIVVKDTGVGIPESNLNKIFNLFFQSSNAAEQTGSGIGLALTKELVNLHKGRIFVESKPGKGTRFTVRIPFNLPFEEQSVIPEPISAVSGTLQPADEEASPLSEKILLVVDDNADIRFFIRSNFEPEFKVLEASDGKEGLALAFRHVPDIIISDVLMPNMDGTEFCKKIKKDERTSHIPVILLTALSSKAHQMDGSKAGADDYITKPFDITLLMNKVDNLLSIREMLRKKYSGETVLKPRNITITSPDERFLQKIIDVVESHLEDPDLDIDKISDAVGVSRTQLYRKLSALTEMTVREFVRSIRLKRAAQLLEQNKMNISEVAFTVGFKDLSHFRKCFRQEFGMSASQYAHRENEEPEEEEN